MIDKYSQEQIPSNIKKFYANKNSILDQLVVKQLVTYSKKKFLCLTTYTKINLRDQKVLYYQEAQVDIYIILEWEKVLTLTKNEK